MSSDSTPLNVEYMQSNLIIFWKGDTALHTMVRQDRLDCALALITNGAEINMKDNEVRF